jgi:hypothetical protein
VRPTFQELEEGCRGHGSSPAASDAPASDTPPSDTPPEAQAASPGA